MRHYLLFAVAVPLLAMRVSSPTLGAALVAPPCLPLGLSPRCIAASL